MVYCFSSVKCHFTCIAGSTYGQACQFIFANTKNIFMKNITTSTSVGVVV